MKKIFIIAAAFFAAATFEARAGSDHPISVSQLPEASRLFLQTHFPGKQVAYAKQERDILEVTYEVLYPDGIKVEFRKSGEWKEVDCGHNPVPVSIVPASIANFVSKHYPQNFIRQIDRGSRDYEVELSGGLELTFDLEYRLIDIDD
ncbi:PepSY-like domain-containing protein [Bacteroides ovatus]|jgi:hypothetical protein|uniref:PepSY-like domain-containing protein n=1 Tax=Bacteroides ovatus TaxID=28116 RepID=UPI00319E3C43